MIVILFIAGGIVAIFFWGLVIDGLSGRSREEEIANERARLDEEERPRT